MLLILLISTIWAHDWHISSCGSQTISFPNLALQIKNSEHSQKTSEVKGGVDVSIQSATLQQPSKSFQAKTEAVQTASECIRKFAVPQLLLTALAITNYHVQIVMRMSSGYIVCYWLLASLVTQQKRVTFMGTTVDVSMVILRFSIIYAMLQGGLFASFLPPA